MQFVISIVLQIAINALILWAGGKFLSDVYVAQDVWVLLLGGALLWAGNAIVRPIVSLLALPLMIVTFGLFHIVITAFILWGIERLVSGIDITSLLGLALLTLFVSVVGAAAQALKK